MVSRPDTEKQKATEELEAMNQVPDDIAKLLMQFKGKKELSEGDEPKLFAYLMGQDILPLVTGEPFKFSKRDYGRLNKAMLRKGVRKKEVEPVKELDRVADEKKREFFRKLGEDSWNIGTDMTMKWVQRAKELGVGVPEMVNAAMEFYFEYSRIVEELEADALANKGMAAMLYGAVSKLSQTITLLRTQLESLEARHPQLRYELIPMNVLTNLERYMPKEEIA